VSIVARSVQLSRDGKIIRVHPIGYDRARELGAFANPKDDPSRELGNRQCRRTIGTHLSPGTRTYKERYKTLQVSTVNSRLDGRA